MSKAHQASPKISKLFQRHVLFNSRLSAQGKAYLIRECYLKNDDIFDFPLEEFVSELSIKINKDDLSDLDVHGYLGMMKKGSVIVVEQSRNSGCQRWTIAYLLWYYFLYNKKVKNNTFFSEGKEAITDNEDENAKQFASSLLMPEDKFCELYETYKLKTEKERCSIIMERFKVSKKAYQRRLRELIK